jgi:acetyltransferase
VRWQSPAGRLKLNIKNAAELKDAYPQVMENARRYNPKTRTNGVLIQEMVSGGTDVIIGVNDDPQFDPTVVFELGGIFVEILKDGAAPLGVGDAVGEETPSRGV